MNIKIAVLLILFYQIGVGSDCVVNSTQTIRDCMSFCLRLFSDPPQRAYYNATSSNCQPIRTCDSILYSYDYSTNKCYMDDSFSKIAPSHIE